MPLVVIVASVVTLQNVDKMSNTLLMFADRHLLRDLRERYVISSEPTIAKNEYTPQGHSDVQLRLQRAEQADRVYPIYIAQFSTERHNTSVRIRNQPAPFSN